MFTIDELFDLSQTAHADIFEGVEFPWEVLPLISEYLEYRKDHARIEADVSRAAHIGKGIAIGEGTVIEPGVIIHGPALIGRNCIIRSGAYIRGNVIIGDDCVVGNSTELKNTLLFNHVAAPHYNYVGDSILGYNTHLGSGVALSNIKTPPSEIKVVTLEKTYNTGLQKFGAIVGDYTEIGANSVLNPGTIIGKRCVIYPLASFRGMLASDSILKIRQQQDIVIKKQA